MKSYSEQTVIQYKPCILLCVKESFGSLISVSLSHVSTTTHNQMTTSTTANSF